MNVEFTRNLAGSVIQATRTVEFEDGLRTGVLPGDCSGALGMAATILELIPNLPGGAGWSWVWCAVLIRPPFTDQILILPSSANGKWVVLNYNSYVVLG